MARRIDEDEEETPAAVYLKLREQQAQRNLVLPAAAPLATRQPVTIDAVPQWLTPTQPFDVGRAWQPLQAAREATSAVDRARGLQLRVLPFLALYAVAAVVVGGVVWIVASNVPVAALLAVLTFAGMGIGTYAKMNTTDYQYSGAGVERHRIDSATYLSERQMEHEQELRRMALDAYLKQLDGKE